MAVQGQPAAGLILFHVTLPWPSERARILEDGLKTFPPRSSTMVETAEVMRLSSVPHTPQVTSMVSVVTHGP